MVRTRVGYAGGTTPDPTYHNLGDHTEVIQIDYDPSQISYKELLDIFWSSHRCQAPAWSRQYMSIVFYHNDKQKKLAIETSNREETKRGVKIFTRIVPAADFYLAEEYHQKYYLRQHPDLVEELKSIYPSASNFIDSTPDPVQG